MTAGAIKAVLDALVQDGQRGNSSRHEGDEDDAWAVFRTARGLQFTKQSLLDALRERRREAGAAHAAVTNHCLVEAEAQRRECHRLIGSCHALVVDLRQPPSSEIPGPEGEVQLERSTPERDNASLDSLRTRHDLLSGQLEYLRKAQSLLRASDAARAAVARLSPSSPDADYSRAAASIAGFLAAPGLEPALHACITGRCATLQAALRVKLADAFAAAFAHLDPLAAPGREILPSGGGGGGDSGDYAADAAAPSAAGHDPTVMNRVDFLTRCLLRLQLGTPPPQLQAAAATAAATAPAAAAIASAAVPDGGSVASVWALDQFLEPVAVRFRFHFGGGRPTDRDDRPEWPLSFLLRALRAYAPLVQTLAQPLLDEYATPDTATSGFAAVFGSCSRNGGSGGGGDDGSGGNGGSGVDAVAYLAHGIALLARGRLQRALPYTLSGDGPLLHAIEEAANFDHALVAAIVAARSGSGGGSYGVRGGGTADGGVRLSPPWLLRQRRQRAPLHVAQIYSSPPKRLARWLDAERSRALAQLIEVLQSPTAWRPVPSPAAYAADAAALQRPRAAPKAPAATAAAGAGEPKSNLGASATSRARRPTASACALAVLLRSASERTAILDNVSAENGSSGGGGDSAAALLRAIDAVQRPLLQRYYNAVYDYGRAQDV
ncbi:unnamed protein product, partial [Phaeothamnion confervicola]